MKSEKYRKEAHDTGDPSSRLQVKRLKVKVTRSLNAVTGSQHIFGTGRSTNFKLVRRMEYDELHHQRAR